MLQYRSPAIERALGKGQGMTVALYSSDTGDRFNGRVTKLIFNAFPIGDKSFGC